MNLFWLGIGGGSLVVIHVLVVLFLRWRLGAPVHGILSVPRFELFLLILMLPCISQSSAFVIKGKQPILFSQNPIVLIATQACFELKTTLIYRWYDRGNNYWGFIASYPRSPYLIGVPFSNHCNLLQQFCSVQGSQACS